MPVIVGALGMIKKGVNKHINKTSGSPGWYEIEKLHLKRVLTMRLKNLSQKKWQKIQIHRIHPGSWVKTQKGLWESEN